MLQNIDNARTDGRPLDGERCEDRLTSSLFHQGPLELCDRLYPGQRTARSFQRSLPDRRKFQERLVVMVDE